MKLGEIAREVKETQRNPLDAGIDRLVGLEHLDPGELKISRWGNVADGTTFTRKFKAGQILFGRRRAYQKKAALADFDGICSGDITVIEAIPGKVVPELLPYIIQNDSFFDYAVNESAGSLSPRVKWINLAEYEVDLPNTDFQLEIAELMMVYDDSIQEAKNILKLLRDTAVAYLEDKFQHLSIHQPLDEVAYVNRGCSWDKDNEFAEHVEGSYPVIRIGNIKDVLDLEDLLYITIDEETFNKYKASKDTTLIVGSNGNKDRVGNCCFVDQDIEFIFASFLVGVTSKDTRKYLAKYIYYCINSKSIQDKISGGTSGSTGINNMGLTFLRDVKIPIGTIDEQNEICMKLDSIYTLVAETYDKLISTIELKKASLNQLLNTGGDHQ